MLPQPDDTPTTAPAEHESLDALAADLRRLSNEAQAITARPQPGTELTLASATSPDAIKTRVAEQRSLLARTTAELQRRRAALESRLKQEVAAVEAVLAPMKKRIDRLNELVWTVNLYLGRDEQIVTLRDGEPAPADTPISVRQMVLSMDEETMIAADSGGIDFRNLDAFDTWVTDPAHLQQVLPEPRGVVVLVPRRRGRDYGDLYTTAVLNKENKRSYWLIRNGDRLFRMSTDFPVGDLLTPGHHEFDDFFTESRYNSTLGYSERVPLEPGSTAWLRAEEKADDRRRHYMRAALILQGLVDRTTVFAPLPAPTVSLLRPDSYDAGHVRLICDADNALGTGRQPFYTWLADRNRALRAGMRIVGAFTASDFTSMRSREKYDYGSHERLRPPRAEAPVAGRPYAIEERRDDGALVIRYERTEEVPARDEWGYLEYRQPKTRASCLLYPSDRFVLPLDLVTVEEMRDYLQARTERHAYLHMLPLLQAAITAKETEADAEAPFRALLAGQIALAHNVEADDATAAIDDLVRWWKHTTVHYRPLIAHTTDGAGPDSTRPDSDIERRAITEIVAEYGARRHAAAAAERDAAHNATIVEQLRAQLPDVMLIARRRDGGYIALSPQPRTYPAPIAASNVYVREHTTGKRAETLTHRDWIIPTRARVDRWTLLWTSPIWNTWDLTAKRSNNLTDPEITTLLNTLRTYGATHQTDTYNHRTSERTSAPTGAPALISCVPSSSGRPSLRLYLNSGTIFTPPDRILTGHLPDVDMPSLTLRWRRGQGNTLDHTISDRTSRRAWEIGRTFPHTPDDTLTPPWRNEPLLWHDPDLVDHVRTQALALHTARQHRNQLASLVHTTRRTVTAAWEARAEQDAYAKFLDDYHDPDLWKGHRKTIQRALTYPHARGYGPDGLTRLLERLIEDGHNLTGHTVATAATQLGENIELPDDILDLPLTAQTTPTPTPPHESGGADA